MEFLLLIAAFFAGLYFFTRNREHSAPPLNVSPKPYAEDQPNLSPEPEYEDYIDEIERKPLEKLVGDEIEIRRAADLFEERGEARDKAYRDQKTALKEAETLLTKAKDFLEASRLDVAIPFLVDETRHWPSWSKAESWKAPLAVSEIAGTTSMEQPEWTEFRVGGGSLFRIEAERSSAPVDDDDEYGTIKVYADDKLVLEAGALRNWMQDWARWRIMSVDALKVGPWVSELVGVYCDLVEAQENERYTDEADFIRERASRIDFGQDKS